MFIADIAVIFSQSSSRFIPDKFSLQSQAKMATSSQNGPLPMGPARFAGLTYSTDPIFQKKTKAGFCHNFYIMYHATDPANVEGILNNGFNLSVGPNQILGDGVYCSLTIKKVSPFIFKNTILIQLVPFSNS